MATVPPSFDSFPTPAPQRGDRATFADRFDAVITWFSTQISKVGAAAVSAYDNALIAASSASAAGAAAEAAAFTANAAMWVSNTTYAKGVNVISPTDLQTYRRKVAGAGAVDPVTDTTNWALLSAQSGSVIRLAEALVSTPVANIDFLNIFTSAYDSYVIVVEGIYASAADVFGLQLATAGAAGAGGYMIGTTNDTTLTSTNLFALNTSTTSATGTSGLNAEIHLTNANGAGTKYKSLFATGSYVDNLGNHRGIIKNGHSTISGPASGFRLLWNGGANSVGGTVRVYGIKNT